MVLFECHSKPLLKADKGNLSPGGSIAIAALPWEFWDKFWKTLYIRVLRHYEPLDQKALGVLLTLQDRAVPNIFITHPPIMFFKDEVHYEKYKLNLLLFPGHKQNDNCT